MSIPKQHCNNSITQARLHPTKCFLSWQDNPSNPLSWCLCATGGPAAHLGGALAHCQAPVAVLVHQLLHVVPEGL
jgi:hypothetical protein